MQKPDEKKHAQAQEKEVIVFLGLEGKVYFFDGEIVSDVYERVIPIIKKRKKRKKESPRGTIIQCSITCSKDHKLTD